MGTKIFSRHSLLMGFLVLASCTVITPDAVETGAIWGSSMESITAQNSQKISSSRTVLVGVHYFGGWYHNYNPGSDWNHFVGYTPRGKPISNFFDAYPSRIPLLGNLTTNETTIQNEIAAADAHGVDYFEVLFYKAGADCGYNTDPNLRYCLDSALAFMLNSSSVWGNTTNLRFSITYSNDVDAKKQGEFVGPLGKAKFANLTKTWVSAMQHPRYLRINGHPVFKVLIPEIFLQVECKNNATLANELLGDLRAAAVAAGLKSPLIGGGWQNPAIPAAPPKTIKPHPQGYMQWNTTRVNCSGDDGGEDGGCIIGRFENVPLDSVVEICGKRCNDTIDCEAFEAHVNESTGESATPTTATCIFKNKGAPGTYDSNSATYVRVPGLVHFDYTGTYNAAPPVCKTASGDQVCPMYDNSWFPNATADGAKIFPYNQCGDFQIAARTNHSNDPVPYVPNVIAGFDPRPWEEHSPSFMMPNETEWIQALEAIKAQCEDPANHFGFPILNDESSSSSIAKNTNNRSSVTTKFTTNTARQGPRISASFTGQVQPAFTVYAWNEYGEGGILAPSRGQGYMKLRAIQKVFRKK